MIESERGERKIERGGNVEERRKGQKGGGSEIESEKGEGRGKDGQIERRTKQRKKTVHFINKI